MIADTYRQAKQPEFDLQKLTLTKSRRETLLSLMESPAHRIYYTPINEWGVKAVGNRFGARVVKIASQGTFEEVCKTHGRHINNLFKAGLLEVDRDIADLDPRVVVFKLAIKGRDLRSLRSKALFDGVERVTKNVLNELAKSYGLRLMRHTSRLFEVEPISESASFGDEAKGYIFENKAGMPVTRYNDMKLSEWDDFFYQKSKDLILK